MNLSTLVSCYEEALSQLFQEGGELLGGNNRNERSIVFRLAVHLRNQFASLEKDLIYLDCEYNRQGLLGDPKLVNREQPYDSEMNKHIIPDILLHKRGCDSKNILYCEVKLDDLQGGNDSNKVRSQVNNKRGYRFGVYIYKLKRDCVEMCIYSRFSGEEKRVYRYANIDHRLVEVQ